MKDTRTLHVDHYSVISKYNTYRAEREKSIILINIYILLIVNSET